MTGMQTESVVHFVYYDKVKLISSILLNTCGYKHTINMNDTQTHTKQHLITAGNRHTQTLSI